MTGQPFKANLDIHPAYGLRLYAWGLIKANCGLSETDYNGIIPITPLSEAPDLTDQANPIFVYGYDDSFSNDVVARKDGSMTFVVYDQNFRRLTKIMNTLLSGFGRWDDAATDVNKYLDSLAYFKGITFQEIHCALLEGGIPEESEGGRQSAVITISFCYTVEYDIITSLPPLT